MGLNYGCKQKLKIKNKLKYSNKEQYEKSLSKNILIELIFYIKNLYWNFVILCISKTAFS